MQKFVTRGKCFSVVGWKVLALKQIVIKLARIHRESNICDCSACFDDVISAVKSIQDLIDLFKLSLLTAVYGQYTESEKLQLEVYKHKLWRLTERAYRSSLRHGYTARTFLAEFFAVEIDG